MIRPRTKKTKLTEPKQTKQSKQQKSGFTFIAQQMIIDQTKRIDQNLPKQTTKIMFHLHSTAGDETKNKENQRTPNKANHKK